MNLQQIRANGRVDLQNPFRRIAAFLLTLGMTYCIILLPASIASLLLGDSHLHTISTFQGIITILTIILGFEWFAETYIDKQEEEPERVD
jgi:hypothetical protein